MTQTRFRGPREVGLRLLIGGTVELVSPCHLGGAVPGMSGERPVLRDATGRPFLSGTTLKGLLRGLLDDAQRPELSESLFGGRWADPHGAQARLLVDDAPVIDQEVVVTELRDSVAIDSGRGIAAGDKKYELELLPVGTRFQLGLELLLWSGAEAGVKNEVLLDGLLVLLSSLEQGRLRLGARTRRGLGESRVVETDEGLWRVERYDLSSIGGLKRWLGRELSGLDESWVEPEPFWHESTASLARWLGWQELPSSVPGRETKICLKLAIDGSIIVRSGGVKPGGADQVQQEQMTVGRGGAEPMFVIPGTSLAGALRHRCLRIANTIAEGEASPSLVEWMFGPSELAGRREQRRDRRTRARASRLRVPEAPICGGRLLRHTRVRIDPWTGGAAEHLLFTEDALYEGSVDITLELDEGDATRARAARALLLLALRDLARGDLAVGGEGGVGRGRLKPAGEGGCFAELITAERRVTLVLEGDGAVRVTPEGALDRDFDELHAAGDSSVETEGEHR